MNSSPINEGLKKRKRICVIIPGHWSGIMGGAQYQVKCIVEELVRQNKYEIYVISRHSNNEYEPSGYKLVLLNYPFSQVRGVHRHLIERIVIPKKLEEIKPDIIYQRVGCSQTGIATHYAIHNRCRMIWHVSSDFDIKAPKLGFSRWIFEKKIDRLYLNYGIRNADRIITQSKNQSTLLRQLFNRSNTRLVRNFHPYPSEDIQKNSRVKVVWVANLKDVKQPEVYIRLSKDLSDLPNTDFVMIGAIQGNAKKRNRYLKLISESKKLNYLGELPQEHVNRVLSESHILINTSLTEGFPNTFIQAWMRRVPVISLKVDPDRCISRNKLGFVSGNYGQLLKDVSMLSQSSEFRNTLGRAVQKYAYEMHSRNNINELLSALSH